MDNNASAQKPVMLVVCGRSCGSIDWVLPVLHAIDQEGELDLKVFFKDEETYGLLRKSFRDLAMILDSSGAELLTKSSLLERLSISAKAATCLASGLLHARQQKPVRALKQILYLVIQLLLLPWSVYRANRLDDRVVADRLAAYLQDRKIAFQLYDHPSDVPVYSRVFPDVEIVYYQHGTLTFERLENNAKHIEHMRRREPLDAIPEHATWLIGTFREEAYYRKIGVPCRIFASGHPKFDPGWSDVLCRYSASILSTQNLRNGKPRVLFLSIPDWKFSDAAHRERLLHQLFRVAKRRDWDLHVKLHPDERRKGFEAIAKSARFNNLQWCQTSVSGAATQVDLVVGFPTSAAMDAVAAGAAVIEFFDFTAQMHSSFVEANGSKESIYRVEGLVEPADNEDDLDRLARRVVTENGYLEGLRAAQRARLAELFAGHATGGTARVLELLRQLRETERSRLAA